MHHGPSTTSELISSQPTSRPSPHTPGFHFCIDLHRKSVESVTPADIQVSTERIATDRKANSNGEELTSEETLFLTDIQEIDASDQVGSSPKASSRHNNHPKLTVHIPNKNAALQEIVPDSPKASPESMKSHHLGFKKPPVHPSPVIIPHLQMPKGFGKPDPSPMSEPIGMPDETTLIEPIVMPDESTLVEPVGMPDEATLVEPIGMPDEATLVEPLNIPAPIKTQFVAPTDSTMMDDPRTRVLVDPFRVTGPIGLSDALKVTESFIAAPINPINIPAPIKTQCDGPSAAPIKVTEQLIAAPIRVTEPSRLVDPIIDTVHIKIAEPMKVTKPTNYENHKMMVEPMLMGISKSGPEPNRKASSTQSKYTTETNHLPEESPLTEINDDQQPSLLPPLFVAELQKMCEGLPLLRSKEVLMLLSKWRMDAPVLLPNSVPTKPSIPEIAAEPPTQRPLTPASILAHLTPSRSGTPTQGQPRTERQPVRGIVPPRPAAPWSMVGGAVPSSSAENRPPLLWPTAKH